MNLISGADWYSIPSQMLSSFPMLLFLSMLPWIASAFTIGEYDRSIGEFIHSPDNKLSSIYGKSVTATYSLLVFINISAIYIAQTILLQKIKEVSKPKRNAFIVKTTLRTFSLAAIWSPMEIIVGITISETGVSFLTYLPYLLGISLFLTIVDLFLNRKEFSREFILPTEPTGANLYKTLGKLSVVLSLFFLTIISLNHFYKGDFILIVSITILPFSLIWSFFEKRIMTFISFGWKSWKSYNNQLQNFTVLFLSLGIFSTGFNHTHIPDLLQATLEGMGNYYVLIFIFVTLIYFFMAMIGVHPIATIAILIEVLRPLFDLINPLAIGIVLIVSALATSASAPYGINATLTAQHLGISPYYITKTNISFSIMMSAVGIIIALLLI
ncbi:hypothetical protein [Lentibacillus sp. JNUCC-1]|uniref:hypothetical protein n=1 Tax=Lentibacillus sp. JNUCC-1 TaxID=2654513 RepID=UPI0012E76354|nr:hypothetical protein [Lentibacillus sp. JNUCC-1]